MGWISIPFLKNAGSKQKDSFQSATTVSTEKKERYIFDWSEMPDMPWTGDGFWANRLQDWRINDGKLESVFRGNNRMLSSLTHSLNSSRNQFRTCVDVEFPADLPESDENRIGMRLGAKGEFSDYRSDAIFGEGLDLGITTGGNVFVGDETIHLQNPDNPVDRVKLELRAQPRGRNYNLNIRLWNSSDGKLIASHEVSGIKPIQLEGGIALLSDFKEVKENQRNKTACRFISWLIEGEKIDHNPDRVFGPVYFSQYTLQKNYLRLTAQLAPVPLPGNAFLEIDKGDSWEQIASAEIAYPSYTAGFTISDWSYDRDISYRVGYELDLSGGDSRTYYWRGTIAGEPSGDDRLNALVCSCNGDHGFPDQEVVDHASLHDADLVMFLGDQFYEGNGGFGIQRSPKEKAFLDYLRKWYQFGWSYRELFRHKPSICIPDDHDVYQGNLFGAEGRQMPDRPGAFDRDWGGYAMPPEWVNLVMETQTSHMPDPHDPEPVKQGIHVFYTGWTYAGVSFAIIEDRKFKSGPKQVLPDEAEERDGFVLNEDFDITEHDHSGAELLGDRQMEFLVDWVEDWEHEAEFKVLVSATPFHSLQTLPNGAEDNGRQPRLSVPRPGEYVRGDQPVADMDSGGWPQNRRNEMLEVIRKAFAVHLAGDQHLGAVTQYGVDDWGDSGYCFAVPALASTWPRRWWPPVPEVHEPLPGQPPYTGNFKDGFGNKMRVFAAANPEQTGLEPSNIYNRSSGYGIVTFDKKKREITVECWPRQNDPAVDPGGQFKGWPLSFSQLDNFQPDRSLFLPEIVVQNARHPVMKVINEKKGSPEHILRIRGNRYRPAVLNENTYSIEITDTASGKSTTVRNLQASINNKQQKRVAL